MNSTIRKIILAQLKTAVAQTKIHFITTKAPRNELIKTIIIFTVISKPVTTSSATTQASIPVKTSFGRKQNANNNIIKKNTVKNRKNGRKNKSRNKMILMRSGMEGIRNKKKIIISNIWKVICMDGERIIINTHQAPQTQTTRNTTTPTPCSTEPSSTARKYSPRKRKTMVSTSQRKIPTSTRITVVPTLDLIFSVISACHGFICTLITHSRLETIKLLTKLKARTHCLNRLSNGLTLRQLRA